MSTEPLLPSRPGLDLFLHWLAFLPQIQRFVITNSTLRRPIMRLALTTQALWQTHVSCAQTVTILPKATVVAVRRIRGVAHILMSTYMYHYKLGNLNLKLLVI